MVQVVVVLAILSDQTDSVPPEEGAKLALPTKPFQRASSTACTCASEPVSSQPPVAAAVDLNGRAYVLKDHSAGA